MHEKHYLLVWHILIKCNFKSCVVYNAQTLKWLLIGRIHKMMLFPNIFFFSGFPQVSMCICTYKVTTSLSECQETRFCVVFSPAGQKTGNLDSTLGVKQSQGIYPGGIVSLQLVCNYAHVKCYHHHLYYHYYYLYCNLYFATICLDGQKDFQSCFF